MNSKKRSGVLPIFRTFPNFIDRMESYVEPEAASTRQLLNSSYDRIAKMLFEALDAVVKDVGNDKVNDDKEHVNVHIMLVENMHFIIAEIRARKLSDLDNYVKLAKNIYEINLVSYCRVVLRKPLGKLLEFFEGVEQILKTQKEEEVSFTIHYSKPVAKELFKKYPGKEIRKGLEVLYKRVDKHYSEDGEGSGQLLQVVWRGIQEEVVVSLRRFEELVMKCYPGSGIRLEFSIEEIVGYFSTMSLD